MTDNQNKEEKVATIRLKSQTVRERVQADWGSLTWLAGQEFGNAEGLALGRVTIKPGHSNPVHSHPNCEEVLYLMKGILEHTIGEQRTVTHAGDVLTVPAGIFHSALNTGDENADMIVAYSEGRREFLLKK